MNTGAVIVAAGMSSEVGEFKPMLKVGAISAAKRIVSTLQQAGAEPVVVVTGNQAETLEKHLSKCGGIVFLRNRNYASSQMFDSARIGLAFIQDKCDRILFTPVDIPLFTANTVLQLCESAADAAIPVCKGIAGHPLLLKSHIISKILDYEGSGGLRGAMDAAGIEVEGIEVEDEGILQDVEAPDGIDALVKYHNSQLLRPVMSLRLAREDIFFGPEEAMLLSLIRDTGSVKLACAQMKLSYSKGWNILKRIGRGVGVPIAESRQGGAGGGYSLLTERGEWLLDCFTAYERDCRAYAENSFEEHFLK